MWRQSDVPACKQRTEKPQAIDEITDLRDEMIMNIPAELVWLILGTLAVLAEVLAVAPGIGLLFSGLGALCVGLLLYSLPTTDFSLLGQVTWFLGFTVLWAVALWKPLKRWRMPSARGQTYSNMLGERATVAGDGLRKGETGQVAWSGTIMNAMLAPEVTVTLLPAGATVEIVAVRGTMLIVKTTG